MPKPLKSFKPYVGRLFELKNFTDMKQFSSPILVMDENRKNVMILDKSGSAVWISKYYLREIPVEGRIFCNQDTVSKAIGFITELVEELNGFLEANPDDKSKQKKKEIIAKSALLAQELRDLGNRTSTMEFAPPVTFDYEEEPKKS